MIGEEEVFMQMARNMSETKRYTSLDKRIREIAQNNEASM